MNSSKRSISRRLGVEAEIGIRMKPVNKGAGRWETSGGDRAKFGLTTPEIVAAIEKLKEHGKGHWLKLLHYHIDLNLINRSSKESAT